VLRREGGTVRARYRSRLGRSAWHTREYTRTVISWQGPPRYTYAYFHAEGFEELYDRRYDPAETRNVAGHPFYGRTVAELRRRTIALKYCAGAASCSRPWPAVPGPLLPPS
jgi:hypothetical protein